mmetsp:Transcript_100149/g.254745  ORF Transcript_100149/g.254745 Transcript_100149/m.254745 type:complete len:682 (-) Transcript_100149:160-2205(-)
MGCLLGLLVHRRALQEVLGIGERCSLLGAGALPRLEVRRDEVAARLDLKQVSLQGGKLRLGLDQVLVFHDQLLCLLGQGRLQIDQSLLQLGLGVLQPLHAVLVVVLGGQLVEVRLLLLGLCVLHDEAQHLDGAVAAFGALALVGVLPSLGGRRIVPAGGLGNLHEGRRLEGLGDRRVVLGQDVDGLVDQSSSLHQVCDVLLIRLFLLGAVLRLRHLVVVVLRQRLLGVLDLHQQARAGVVDGGVELRDGVLELPDRGLRLVDGLVGVLALFVAPRLLLNVGLLFLLDEVEHLADLLNHGLEGIVGLQHRQDAGEQRSAVGVGLARLQEGLRAQPADPSGGLTGGHGGVLAVHADGAAAELDEGDALARGGDGAEGCEGFVAVKDGDRLRQGGILLRPKSHPLLVLLLLRGAHVQELGQEVLGRRQLSLGSNKLAPLRRQVVVVVAELALLVLVGRLHLVVRLLHLLHKLVVGLLGPSLGLARGREVGLEGVAHGLQDADDLAGPGAVGAREGSLQERVDGGHLLLGHEGRGRQQRGVHRGLEFDEAALGHVLHVVPGDAQGLIRGHLRERLDGVVHLVDGRHQIRLLREERRVLLLANGGGRRTVVLVLGHVLVQPGDLLAELAAGGLQLLNLGLQNGDLLVQAVDLGLLLSLVGVAIAFVLGEEVPLGVALGLRLLQQLL